MKWYSSSTQPLHMLLIQIKYFHCWNRQSWFIVFGNRLTALSHAFQHLEHQQVLKQASTSGVIWSCLQVFFTKVTTEELGVIWWWR